MNYTVTVDGDTLTATAPAYREDIEDYPDLAEDIIKMYGYEHITPRLMTPAGITAGGYNRAQRDALKLKEALVGDGFYELINYSFYSEADLAILGLPEGHAWQNFIRIQNPISENYAIMRTTLAPSLIRILSHNMKRGHEDGRFFELANTFAPAKAGEMPRETMTLCFALFGKNESFFTAKGAVEAIAEEFGLTFTYERTAHPHLHPGITAKVMLNGNEIGYIGQVSYECADAAELTSPAFVGEINYDLLSESFPELVKYAPIPKFPTVTRDLALVADEAMTCGEITDVIKSACKNVSEVRLFDIYRSAQVGEGKKSMAFGLTFVPGDAPLTPEAVDKFVEKIVKSLAFRLQITLR